MTRPPDGVLLIDKPAGATSHDMVARVRRSYARGVKVGHAGTLDPFATGLLLVLTGRATRVQRFIMELPKRYEVVAHFGATSTTGDPEGEITETGAVPDGDLRLPVGPVRQRPPAYSAVKVGGRRAYALARAGEQVELAEREVRVYRFEELWRDGDRRGFVVECSSGTYIRSLIADLGDAYCLSLRRTRIGEFDVARADDDRVIPLGEALGFLPAVVLDEERARRAAHGGRIKLSAGDLEDGASQGSGSGSGIGVASGLGNRPGIGIASSLGNRSGAASGVVRLLDADGLIALAEPDAEARELRPVVGFRG